MKIKLSKSDLVERLETQLKSLKTLCSAYDAGEVHIAQDIAVKLRVIFHQTNSSKSLIKQLKLEHLEMVCSSNKYNVRNLISHTGLVGMRVGNSSEFIPLVTMGGMDFLRKHVSLENWLNSNKVIVDSNKATFTRKKIFLSVSNTDGGAHVDDGLDEQYYNLSRLNSCGWQFSNLDGTFNLGSPVPASLRQMAFEVLETFEGMDIYKESKLVSLSINEN